MARRAAFVSILGTAVLFIAAPAASADWAKVPAGAASLNRLSTQSAGEPSVASVGGVPYLVWEEGDGAGHIQLRADRLAADGSGWEPVGDSLNRDPTQVPAHPSVVDVGGVPYVVWHEFAAGVTRVYVDRLNAAGAWEPVGGALNRDSSKNAANPALAAVNGVPYVVWQEFDGANNQIYVDRLAGDGTTWQPVGISLNRDASRPGYAPTIAVIDGVPYVSWYEQVNMAFRVFIDRLDADGTTWDPIGIRLNRSATSKAFSPQITSVGGVPYVALTEFDTGDPGEAVYVNRLDPDGTTWDPVGGSLNRNVAGVSINARIATVAGAPYVSWAEETGGGPYQVHVDRLGPDGVTWEPVGSPTLNDSSSDTADVPSLTTVDGVPYLGWDETEGGHPQVRVSRLEPEFGTTTATPTETGATLTTEVHTYGIGYPVGFEYGGVLEMSTTPTPAPGGADTTTVSQDVTGLPASTTLYFRPFATAGVAQPRVPGATQQFTTLPDKTPPVVSFDKKPKNKVEGSKATYKFSSSEAGSSFECKLDHKRYKPCTSPHKVKHLKPGKHRFKVEAIDAAGNTSAAAKDKFRVV